jgi:hypothetical protein
VAAENGFAANGIARISMMRQNALREISHPLDQTAVK